MFQQRVLHTSLLTVYAFGRPRAVTSFKHFEVKVGQAISSKNQVTIGEPVLMTLFEAILRGEIDEAYYFARIDDDKSSTRGGHITGAENLVRIDTSRTRSY